jgi:hypothetical protein
VSKSRRRLNANSVRVAKVEAQRNTSSSPPRSPEAARTKNNAQVAYGVRFARSLYGWKENFVELPMERVPHQNYIWVDRNRQNKWTFRICQGVAPLSFGPLTRVSS